MAYTSYFANNSTTKAQPNTSGNSTGSGGKGGYKSFFGFNVKQAPTSDELTKSRAVKAQQDTAAKQLQQKQQADAAAKAKSNSLFTKIVSTAKGVGNSAIAGERTAATGVTRILPGGTADIKAKQKATEQANKDVNFLQQQKKTGQIPADRANKLIATRASEGSAAAKETGKIVKALPSKGQVAAGFASTAADIATAGTIGGIGNAAKTGKIIKGAELAKADKTAKTLLTTQKAKVVHAAADIGKVGAANAAAGGFNAAAAGGSKSDIARNTAAGAALPEGLRLTGVAATKVGSQVVDKISPKSSKTLLTNTRTQQLLKAGQEAKPKTVAAQVNQDHVTQGLIKPELKQTPIKDLVVSADHNTKLDSQKVAQYKKQIKDGEPIEPVVIHTVNGQRMIVDGQHKLEAAKQLGYEHVPTVEKIPGASPGAVADIPATTPNAVSHAAAPATVGTVRATDVSSTHPITQAIDSVYKGGKQGPEEAKALEHLRQNPEKAMSDYDARVKEKFGASNVVSGDEAKYVIPSFNATKSATYHEPASALAKAKYQQLLADTATKDKPVLLMSGGSGAGKTSALKRLGINYDNYAAVIDTNSNKLDSAEKRIQQALASGREVQVFHVHRDPLKAFTHGVIPRGAKEDRIVPIENHLDTHYGSHEAIQQIHAKYKDHPLVDVGGASNDHGHGKAKEMPIDNIPQMAYTRDNLKTKLQEAVDNAHTQGKITTAERDAYHGTNASEANGQLEARPSQRSEPQRATGSGGRQAVPATKVATSPSISKPVTGTSKVAQRIARNIKGEYGDLAEYEKINIKDQASRAEKLLTNREQLDKVISGEKPLPSGLRATSIITAVRSDPVLSKDGELLRKLASSPLASESSLSAQELRLARENAKHDPVMAIKNIQDARAKAIKRRTGKTVTKAVNDEVKAIRAQKPHLQIKDWDSFVESIKC